MSTLLAKLYRNLPRKGFILPFTMLIVTLVLFVFMTGSNSLAKQLFFSKMYRQSQTAYYIADDAVSCTLSIDDTFQNDDGYGIFPGVTSDDPAEYMAETIDQINVRRLIAGLTTIFLEDIKCAQVAIFDTAQSGFEVSSTDYEYDGPSGLEVGKTSTFNMRMPDKDGTFRCAKVTVNRTQFFRQIIGQGYSACGGGLDSVERAVVNTTVYQ